jgi:CrcB protein
MVRSILLVAFGGACGALGRYGLAVFMQRLAGSRFPLGTLTANLLGCLLIGLIFALSVERGVIAEGARLAVMVGFLGSFTTFSSYALESVNLVRGGDPGLALANLALNNGVGLLFVLAGYWLGRAL